MPGGYAESDVAGQDACQERAGGVAERAGACQACAGPVQLQTKALLCSDRHSSPGMPRMAKSQTSTSKRAGGGRYPFRVMPGQSRRRTTEDQEVFSLVRVTTL